MYALTVRLFLFSVISTATLSAQSQQSASVDQFAELRQEIASIKHSQARIETALSALKDMLSGVKPPLENVFVGISNSPSLGRSSAPVVIVEFTDFQCSYCGAYARETLPRLVKDYVNTGKVRYVIRNFPLEHVHSLARKAAETVLCAGDQHKFWDLHDRLFSDQTKLAVPDIISRASAIGVEPTVLETCTNDSKYKDVIDADLAEAQQLEVTGTPTFFIGYTDPADPSRMHAIRSISGAVPYFQFVKTITEVLARPPQASGEPQ